MAGPVYCIFIQHIYPMLPMSAAPERIHPALWRGSQLIPRAGRCAPAGHPELAAELPGGGWPLGALVELMLPHPGIGEIHLFRPALAGLAGTAPVALLHTPYPPQVACWSAWRLDPARLLWVQPERAADVLWAAEQILKSASCAALFCWSPRAVRDDALRRLHLAAQSGDTLFVMLRPAGAAVQPSPAPLRLALEPDAAGLRVTVLKRRGPLCAHPLRLSLDAARAGVAGSAISAPDHHATVDRPAPAQTEPGRLAPALAD
jgi:Uncharacterized conserved protein